MAIILFRLRNVPEDEANDVRQLLDQHAIDWYETSAGKFQISFPAIWISDNADEPRARQLIDTYQQKRKQEIRAEQAARDAAGESDTFLTRAIANPLPVLGTLLFVALILYLSIKPFISLISR